MTMMLLVVLGLVASASACCFPDQWTADMGTTYATWNETANNGSYIEGSIELTFDAKHQIIAENQKLYVDDKLVRQRLVLDFAQGIAFVIREDLSCSKHMLGKWAFQCLAANATDGHSHTYGLGDQTVVTKLYDYMMGPVQVYMMVTADTCVPVSENTYSRIGPIASMTTLSYANVKAGITDPMAFFVPVTCTNALPILPQLAGTEGFTRRAVHLQH